MRRRPTTTAAPCWSPRACSPRPPRRRPLREATQTGLADDGRIAWTTRVAPQAPPGESPDLERVAETMPIRLYRVTAEVVFPAPTGGQRKFTLATTRIGARDPK